jgi:rhodanese-related sulfurtransferase
VPSAPKTIDQLLSEARARLHRLTPAEAHQRLDEGAVLIDIRAESQRARDGVVPASTFIPRNVLEWRLDPASPHRAANLARHDAQIIVMCDEGYQSSLAAATLQDLGIARATDLVGGFQAWRAAGLPLEESVSDPGPPSASRSSY